MLLSLLNFEGFYGGVFGLSREEYLKSYRNDFSWDYARGLRENGFDCVIYIPSWGGGAFHHVEQGIDVSFLPIKSWYRLWSFVGVINRSPPLRYISEVANTLAFLSGLSFSLERDEIDVLYVQEYWTGRFDVLAHTVKLPMLGADHGGRRNRQITVFKKSSFRRVPLVTCQTQDECDEVSKFGAKPIFLPNGVDAEFFAPAPDIERETLILTVARLTDGQKRTSDLIRAIALLPECWHLVIAGTGPDEAMLRRLTVELHVEGRVSFLGFLTDKTKLRDLYNRCGVFGMASKNEAVALALLEAMCCGAPLAVSDIRGFSGVVEDGVNGFKFEVGDITGIAAAIESAFRNRRDIGAANVMKARQIFSSKSMIYRLKNVLEPLLKCSSRF